MRNTIDKVVSVLNFIFGIIGLIMILIATYAVFGRNVTNVSTPWADELLKLFFVWTIYVGSAVLFLDDGLISLTLIEDSYKEKKPKVFAILKAIQYISGVGLCALLTTQLWTIIQTQISTGEATTVLEYPLWVMNMGMLVGFVLIVFLGIYKLVGLKDYFVKK